MAKKLTNEEASVVMLAAGLTPLMEYPGAREPWLCRCDGCGREVTPRRDNIVTGKGGCKFCAGQVVDDPSAVMIAAGLTPLVDYPGTMEPWLCIHEPCGRKVKPQRCNIVSGRGGCKFCAGQAVEDHSAVMIAAGYTPLVRFPGSNVPWLCRCDVCGSKVKPRRSGIVSGQGGCAFCAGQGRTIGTGTVGPDGIGRLDLAGGKGVTLVDLIDFPAVVETCWYNNRGYAATSGSLYLAQVVAARAGIVLVGDETIDHINRNRLDNRRDNLRAASKKLQTSNQGPPTIGVLCR